MSQTERQEDPSAHSGSCWLDFPTGRPGEFVSEPEGFVSRSSQSVCLSGRGGPELPFVRVKPWGGWDECEKAALTLLLSSLRGNGCAD